MWKYIKDIACGAYSIAVGMGITLRHVLRRAVTVNYPYERLTMPDRFRGHIELKRDPQTKEPKCIACMACQKACPSNCIKLEGHKPEGAKRRVVSRYDLDFSTCSLCGLCVESCNFDALEFSKDYNLAFTSKSACQMDLLKTPKERK